MTLKRQRCDDCGKRDGDRAPDGRILLVFNPGMEGDPKLCAPCLEARRPTFLDPPRRRKGESDLEFLTRPNPLLQDAPYAEMPKAEDFVGLDAVLPKFVDPLEQLELGRAA